MMICRRNKVKNHNFSCTCHVCVAAPKSCSVTMHNKSNRVIGSQEVLQGSLRTMELVIVGGTFVALSEFHEFIKWIATQKKNGPISISSFIQFTNWNIVKASTLANSYHLKDKTHIIFETSIVLCWLDLSAFVRCFLVLFFFFSLQLSTFLSVFHTFSVAERMNSWK